ncbi:MAG: XrtA system polysaccharide deacetylase [Pseudomonadota bacterium]
MNTNQAIVNAMTVDVEEYFHVAALASAIDKTTWDSIPSRVESSTNRLLELFDEQSISATFFILGWVAERAPQLIRRIADSGHEVACHGQNHQLIYNQAQQEFKEETFAAKALLEDITGKPVSGYRAASYSITPKSIWALDVLKEAGFKYDSSIVPVHHDIYGFVGTPDGPYDIVFDDGHRIIEYPPPTVDVMGRVLPIGGGGYFRIFPYWFSRWGLGQVNKKKGIPFSFYLHPWEVDPGQPRVNVGAKSRFRHYTNLGKCADRLRRLTNEFRFDRMDRVIADVPRSELTLASLKEIASQADSE